MGRVRAASGAVRSGGRVLVHGDGAVAVAAGAGGGVSNLFQLTDESVDFFRHRLSFSHRMAVLALALPSAGSTARIDRAIISILTFSF